MHFFTYNFLHVQVARGAGYVWGQNLKIEKHNRTNRRGVLEYQSQIKKLQIKIIKLKIKFHKIGNFYYFIFDKFCVKLLIKIYFILVTMVYYESMVLCYTRYHIKTLIFKISF